MKSIPALISASFMATLILSACGQTPQETSSTKDVADCHSIFANRIQLSVGPYSGGLTVYPRGNGLALASIDGSDGLEADCGRSDVQGTLSYSYVPFTADYTMTLDLTSASCGNRRIVVTGDCESNGTASAEWGGYEGSLHRIR